MSLRILSRVENTSIQPKVFNILIDCYARQCNTPTANGSHNRFKGKNKCCNCPAARLVIHTGDRYRYNSIAKCYYTQENFDKLFSSILDGTVHQITFTSYGKSGEKNE